MPLSSHERQSWTMHRAILLAGFAGAISEVIWIALFCALTPLSSDLVLRQITASFFPSINESMWAPALGLTIHLALGIAVAYAFSLLIWRPFAHRIGKHMTLCAAVLSLAVIWYVNFFVVLPRVNIAFAGLMPYAVTFASKLLFGVTMGTVLNSLAPTASELRNGAAGRRQHATVQLRTGRG